MRKHFKIHFIDVLSDCCYFVLMTRYTDDERRAILDDLASSRQSRAAFCRERSLCYKRVGRWVKVHIVSTLPVGFVEVDPPVSLSSTGIEVWLPSSICVRFGAGAPTSTLVDFRQKVSGC